MQDVKKKKSGEVSPANAMHMEEEVKQVIVIRKDLKMRRGKEIAQGAHASMKVFFDRMERQYEIWYEWDVVDPEPCKAPRDEYKLEATKEMVQWKEGAFTKVVCKVQSEEELLDLVKQAEEAGIPHALIEDSGRTEFGGVPTHTCCAIGPDKASVIDKITGNLSLY